MKTNLSKINIDLSTKEHSMCNILKENQASIWAATSVDGLANTLTALFKANCLDTKASNRLLANVRRCRSLLQAQYTVTNSYVAGTGNAVI